MVRSVESSALRLLRALEGDGVTGHFSELAGYAPTAVALYVLNQKRSALAALEARYKMAVSVLEDNTLIPLIFVLNKSKIGLWCNRMSMFFQP